MLGVYPDVKYAVGSGTLKGEDVIVAHERRLWPGSDYDSWPVELARPSPPPPATPAPGGPARLGPQPYDSVGELGMGDDTAALPPMSPGGEPPAPAPSHYSFWCVFDGHNGVAAASMAAEHVTEIVEELLPYGPPEPPDSPYYQEWCEEIQRALAETVAALNLLFAGRGIVAGCTATLVLQVGWLVTCANVGDSRALLDTGRDTMTLTVDHRVATHKAERRRVEAMGATIAPIDFTGNGPARDVNNGMGPLRIWPGGLCLSRAVGDFDVGEPVIPLPYICQVVLPPTGGRLMIASDGVWDAFDKMTKVGSMSRSWPLDSCADRMIQTIVRTYGGLRDDTSLIVVDITPPGKTFLEAIQSLGKPSKSFKSQGLISQLASPSPVTPNGNGNGGSRPAPPSTTAAGGAHRPPAKRKGGCFCFGGSAVVEAEEELAAAPVAAGRTQAGADPRALAPRELPLSDSPNPSVRQGSQLQIVAGYDVAEVMGLMPETKVEPPGWYGPEVGERLFRMVAESMVVWKEAVRSGSRHGPSPGNSFHRGSLVAGLMAESDAAAAAAAAAGTGGSGLRRAPSMFFAANVADEESYGSMFGHYSMQGRVRGSNGSEDSSVRGGRQRVEGSHRGGRAYFDPSVRAGRAYHMEPSVRAGQQYGGGGPGEASVRAGRYGGAGGGAGGQDASVRAGGAVALDASVRAGSAGLQRSGGSGGGLQGLSRGVSLPSGDSLGSASSAGPGEGSVRGNSLSIAPPASTFAQQGPLGAQQRAGGDSVQEEVGRGIPAGWPKTEEDLSGLAPIRTVRFGAAELERGPGRSTAAAGGLLARANSGGMDALSETGPGRRGSSNLALAPPDSAEGAGGAPPPSAPVKVVRFAEESPVDHFTGLSHASSILSSVDEDRVLSQGIM